MTQVGVDVVARAKDETAAGLDSAAARLEQFGRKAEAVGDNLGRRFSSNLTGAIVSGLAAAGLDRLLEGVLDAQKQGQSIGQSLVQGIIDSLRNVPIAGPLGELIPRTVDRLMGGDGMTFEERQQGLDQERQKRLRTLEEEKKIRERLTDDQLTEEQRRRRQFGEQIRPILQDIDDPAERAKTRDRLLEEFRQREERDRKRREEEERAKERERRIEEQDRQRERLERAAEREAEQQARDKERQQRELEREQERSARERERLEAKAASEAERRRAANEAAAGDLPGLVQSRFSSGRAAAFRSSGDVAVQVQKDSLDVLRQILEANRKQIEALDRSQAEVVG